MVTLILTRVLMFSAAGYVGYRMIRGSIRQRDERFLRDVRRQAAHLLSREWKVDPQTAESGLDDLLLRRRMRPDMERLVRVEYAVRNVSRSAARRCVTVVCEDRGHYIASQSTTRIDRDDVPGAVQRRLADRRIAEQHAVIYDRSDMTHVSRP